MKKEEILQLIIRNLNDLTKMQGVSIIEVSHHDQHYSSPVYPDLLVGLEYRNIKINLACEVIDSIRPVNLTRDIEKVKNIARRFQEALPIILAKFVSGEIRKRCIENEVGYIDCSGNIYISAPGILISKETDKNLFPEKRETSVIFRDRASIILKKLLTDVQGIRKIRDLHRETGVSLGHISAVIKALEKSSYIVRVKDSGIKLVRLKELLSEWLGFYRFERLNQITPYFFNVGKQHSIINEIVMRADHLPSQKYCFTLHAAGDYVAPWVRYQGVHMYIDGPPEPWRNLLGLISAKQDANLFIIQPYYETSVFYDSHITGNFVPLVSDIQLFLDLYHYPQRGREAAEHLFKIKLKEKLKLSELP